LRNLRKTRDAFVRLQVGPLDYLRIDGGHRFSVGINCWSLLKGYIDRVFLRPDLRCTITGGFRITTLC
jgi:hypothetical protein